jgi:hypothetical protein
MVTAKTTCPSSNTMQVHWPTRAWTPVSVCLQGMAARCFLFNTRPRLIQAHPRSTLQCEFHQFLAVRRQLIQCRIGARRRRHRSQDSLLSLSPCHSRRWILRCCQGQQHTLEGEYSIPDGPAISTIASWWGGWRFDPLEAPTWTVGYCQRMQTVFSSGACLK